MAEKVSIWADGAPQPFGHYCQAIKMEDMVYISGQLPIDATSGKPQLGTAEEQSRLVLNNLTALLQACGGQMSNILMTTLYLTDLKDFPVFDKVAKEVFFFLPPARTTIGVSALPGGCKVCVDAVAKLNVAEVQGKSMI